MDTSRKWIWLSVVIVVVIAFCAMQFMRANRPVKTTADEKPQSIYTTGTIVEGSVVIPAEQFLQYRMNFNKRTHLRGTSSTGDSKRRFSVIVLSEKDFEGWKAGSEFKAIANTGYVPRAQIDAVIEPGVYYLVFENLKKDNGEITSTVNFIAE